MLAPNHGRSSIISALGLSDIAYRNRLYHDHFYTAEYVIIAL
jgi:hypothetical protein